MGDLEIDGAEAGFVGADGGGEEDVFEFDKLFIKEMGLARLGWRFWRRLKGCDRR